MSGGGVWGILRVKEGRCTFVRTPTDQFLPARDEEYEKRDGVRTYVLPLRSKTRIRTYVRTYGTSEDPRPQTLCSPMNVRAAVRIKPNWLLVEGNHSERYAREHALP